MRTLTPSPARVALRVALPPSMGDALGERANRAAQLFSSTLGENFVGYVVRDYRQLLEDLRNGDAALAWAPPVVCGQAEAIGLPVLGRGVRKGAASFRCALVARKGEIESLSELEGRRALWVDRESAGGYLLALNLLQKAGLDPSRLFSEQRFVGSYKASVEGVLSGAGDVGVAYAAPSTNADAIPHGLLELVPDRIRNLDVLAYSDDCPNDGLVLGMAALNHQTRFTAAILMLQENPAAKLMLRSVFGVERFERVGARTYLNAAPRAEPVRARL